MWCHETRTLVSCLLVVALNGFQETDSLREIPAINRHAVDGHWSFESLKLTRANTTTRVEHQLLSPVAGLVAGCFGYCTSSASRSGCHPRQQLCPLPDHTVAGVITTSKDTALARAVRSRLAQLGRYRVALQTIVTPLKSVNKSLCVHPTAPLARILLFHIRIVSEASRNPGFSNVSHWKNMRARAAHCKYCWILRARP
eukprot:IDg5192t1